LVTDSVAFNQAGSQVAVGYQDGTVAVFDARSGRVLHEINVRFVVHDARFIGGSGALVIATQGGAALWRPAAGPGFQRLSAEPANTVAVDPRDDLEFAVATGSGTRIWKLRKSLRPVRPGGLNLPSSFGLTNNDAEFNPGGTQVVTAGSDGLVRVYDAATATLAATLYAGQGRAESAAFSPDGKLIVAGYSSGATIVWDAVTHVQQTQVAGNQSPVFTARFSGNSREVVTASGDGTVRISDALPSELRRAFVTSFRSGAPTPVFAAQYSSDGRRILVVDGSGRAYVVAGNGKPLAVIHPPGTDVSVDSAKFSLSGQEIVTADSDGTVDLWRATGSGSLRQVTLRSSIRLPGPAQYATFSPRGPRIVAVTGSDTAEVFSARTGRLLHTLDPHSAYQLSVAVFSPDGRQILTGDLNGQVEVWDAATGAELRVLGKGGQGIKDVEFDRTGREFVTASTSGAVTIWSSSGYRKLHAFTTCLSPSTASFSPNGQQVVVGCPDGTIAVFDVKGRQIISMSDPGTVNSAAFSPDGKSIVTTFAVADTGGVRIWSSQLATSSLRALKRLARLRIAQNGTPRLSGLLGG
jgi:WD40 repeat protein